ncbi:Ribosome maturation factor rimM [Gemella morbillorum]|jgi:16S rRNA processing protein rimM|uniref:ribosome maturation factor RimM n=1 Tax=Gemella morbillorum TaxID=29391 RepID=UPI000DA40A6B|nr:ribosome maturation factor RimM [Gemella morbillorum]MBF1209304.1 ribosome maturation factor RimM [Gemella morbillorum]MDK8239618.1 ribosome maturation factor RimM [Gemella morbillorum]MDK8255565.1 ribosome maturation factor RimM [Gemella morbillorum]UBH81502.1 ribosome maturation factor RimM [Gemella morbillorum]SQH55273.1 Ribosome maturation factor rimM [Gemella morbillorum]
MRLKVGKIVNTHSLKGEVKVISSTDFEEERFKKGSKLLITRGNQLIREVVVQSYRNHKNFLLVKFEGIDSVEEAEKLKNLQIKIDSDEVGELEENEFYFHQIIGCEVFDENDKNLGEIIDILTPGANDVWVIKGENGKEILIPYIEDVVKKIDITSKKVNIEVMEGLID